MVTIAVFFLFIAFEPADVTLAIHKAALLLTRMDRVPQLFVDHDALVVDWHTPADLHLLALGPGIDGFRVDCHRRLRPSGALS